MGKRQETKQCKTQHVRDAQREDEHQSESAPALALGVTTFNRFATAAPVAAATTPAKAAADQNGQNRQYQTVRRLNANTDSIAGCLTAVVDDNTQTGYKSETRRNGTSNFGLEKVGVHLAGNGRCGLRCLNLKLLCHVFVGV
jgi:hypothetical protein